MLRQHIKEIRFANTSQKVAAIYWRIMYLLLASVQQDLLPFVEPDAAASSQLILHSPL